MEAFELVERVIKDVQDERKRQDEKWGEQNHDPFFYLTILMEEVGETAEAALDLHHEESDINLTHLRLEAIQTAAVAQAIVECLDRDTWRWGK